MDLGLNLSYIAPSIMAFDNLFDLVDLCFLKLDRELIGYLSEFLQEGKQMDNLWDNTLHKQVLDKW